MSVVLREHRRVAAGGPAGRFRLLGVFLAAVSAGSLALVGVTWACIPQARLVVVTPQASGAAGSQVTVQGIGFDAPPSSSEVRWNTVDGPMLAQATDADFSVPVTIPDVPPGLYSLLVMSRDADGVLANTGRASFQVTGTGSSEPVAPVGGSPVASAGSAAAKEAQDDDGPNTLLLAAGALAIAMVGGVAGAAFSRRGATIASPGTPMTTGGS